MAEFADYFWPGTDVLVNKLGITDPVLLREVEYEWAGVRQEEIVEVEVKIPQTFDAEHLSAVHAHLFGDVYEWAGQWREVDMQKGGTAFAAVPREVNAQLADAAELAASTDWSALDRPGFVAGVAQFYAHLNHAHPFREGNGRAGKLVVDQLAEQTPFEIKWDAVSTAWWNMASRDSIPPQFSGRRPDPAPLVGVFEAMTIDRAPSAGTAGQAGADRDVAQQLSLRGSDAVRLAARSHPRSVAQQLSDRAGAGADPTRARAARTQPGRQPARGRGPGVGG